MDAETFRSIRVKAGLTQSALGERMKHHQWLVSNYERGIKQIPDDIAEFMTKLGQGKAASSPPKRRVAENRKAPPARHALVKRSPRPSSADKLCGRCLCVTDKHIPCGCWSWAG